MIKKFYIMSQIGLVVSVTKIIAAISVVGAYLLAGSMPLKFQTVRTNRFVLSFLSAISGGLLLAVSLIQILPYAVTLYPNGQEDFPYASFVMVLTFLFLLFLEKIIIGPEESVDIDSQQLSYSITDREQFIKESISTKVSRYFSKTRIAKSIGRILSEEQRSDKKLYLILLTLSVTNVLEGLFIGQEDTVSRILIVGLAMVIEKWSEGLALGFAFRQGGITPSVYKKVFILISLLTPVGITVGWILENTWVGVLQSISAGAFFYHSTQEIIVEEFNIARFKFAKYMGFTISIGVVIALWAVE